MDENLAELLSQMAEELAYYMGNDIPGEHLDSSDADRLIAEAEQAVYEHECSKVTLVDGRPKPLVLRGYI